MTGKVYERLKWSVLIAFPAFITFYGVVASVWGIPYTEPILTTLASLNALSGTLLGISSVNYYKNQK
jgi:hypothetical protein